jgi:hypothetical protein
VWFGIIIAMNLQTSFLTPPFGFALFYLRSVAAREDYTDRVTRQRIPAVTTTQIYKGSIAFIVLQVIMVSAIIAFPGLVTGNLGDKAEVDESAVMDMLEQTRSDDSWGSSDEDEADPADDAPAEDEAVDPIKAIEEAARQGQ